MAAAPSASAASQEAGFHCTEEEEEEENERSKLWPANKRTCPIMAIMSTAHIIQAIYMT